MSDEAEWTQYVEAPRFAGFPTFLKNECWIRGLHLELEVDKGWLRETVRFKIWGPRERVEQIGRYLQKTMAEYNARGEHESKSQE